MQTGQSPRDRRLLIARRLAITLLATICTYVAFLGIAPFLISSSLVRSSMERAVSQWTGHRAVIAGMPQITFWPEPRITLLDISISKETEGEQRLIGRVEELSAEFGLLDAIGGNPVFHDFKFVRPRLFITRNEAGHLDWTNEGLLSTAIRAAEAREGNRQTLRPDLDAHIGSLTVEDGSVEISDIATGRLFELTGIAADLTWPRLSEDLRANARVEIAGEELRLDIASPQPLLLLGGQNAQARVNLRSQVFNATYEGAANLVNGYFLSGSLDLNVADIPTVISWTGATVPEMKPLKEGKLQANLTTVGDSLRFGDLKFSLNDIAANGIVELSQSDGLKPQVSGTLAFGKLDIGALLAAFSLHLPLAAGTETPQTDGLLNILDLDLTLSARNAVLGPFAMEEVAASVLTREGKAKLDIADSRFEGGRLTGHLDSTGSGFENGGNLMISVRDTDLQGIARRLQLEGPIPAARGSLDLTMHSKRPLWATRLGDIDGSIRLRTTEGTLSGIDLVGIKSLAGKRAYFRLSEAGDDDTAFTQIDMAAKFAAGAAEVEKAELLTKTDKLTFSGLIPYASNSLALLGQMEPVSTDSEPAAADPLRFFIGGSWPDPILSPILALPEQP